MLRLPAPQGPASGYREAISPVIANMIGTEVTRATITLGYRGFARLHAMITSPS